MLSNGFFWLFLIMFFAFGPFSRRRWTRGRWGWGPWWGDEQGRKEPDGSPRDDERERRREEQVVELETRVAELESRLDFAERLLAQRREPSAAPGDRRLP